MPEDPDFCNDPTHDHGGERFQMLGALFGPVNRQERNRAEMQALSLQQRLYVFLDGLDIEQLYMLRRILMAADKSTSIFLEGQVVSLLRLRGADPDTGQTLEAMAEADAAASAADPKPDPT